MRKINNIVVHCTATPQNTKLEYILSYWKDNLGWKMPGYHYVILPTGEIKQLLNEAYVSNGVKGHNHDSVHLSYIGGVYENNKPFDNRTEQQKSSILELLKELKGKFSKAKILGHRDFEGVAKDCPSFDAKVEYKGI